jgi:hypothetical protein
MERADAAAALHQGDHNAFASGTATALGDVRAALALVRRLRISLLAEIGFVRFDNLTVPAERRQIEAATAHRFHDSVMQEPSCIVLAAQFAVELVGGKALLAIGRQMERSGPLSEFRMAALHETVRVMTVKSLRHVGAAQRYTPAFFVA